jgi:hypothetical protein
VYRVDVADHSARSASSAPGFEPASGSSSGVGGVGPSRHSRIVQQQRQSVWKVLSHAELVTAGATGMPQVVQATAMEGLPFQRLGAHQDLACAWTRGVTYLRVADECVERLWEVAVGNVEQAVDEAAQAHDMRPETCPPPPALPEEPKSECLQAALDVDSMLLVRSFSALVSTNHQPCDFCLALHCSTLQ